MTSTLGVAFLAIALGAALLVWNRDLADAVARHANARGRRGHCGLRVLCLLVGLAVTGSGVFGLAVTFRD